MLGVRSLAFANSGETKRKWSLCFGCGGVGGSGCAAGSGRVWWC